MADYQDDYRRVSTQVDIDGLSEPTDYTFGTLSTSTGLEAFNDPTFMAEMREYYAGKGQYFNSETDLIDTFYTDNQWQNMNSVSLGKEVAESMGADSRQRQLMIRMNEVFDSVPDFYEEGGRGAKGLAINVAAAVTDPLNLIGFGAGGQAAKAVLRQGAQGALKAGMKKGAIAEGAASGIAETGFNSLEQARDINLGIRDEYSFGDAAVAGGSGILFGAGAGAVFGGLGAQYQKMGRTVDAPGTIFRENRRLVELGWTEDEIPQLPQGTVNQILKNNIPPNREQPNPDVDPDPNAPEAGTAEAETQGPDTTGRMPTDLDLEVDLVAIQEEIKKTESEIVQAMDGNPGMVDDLVTRARLLNDMLELNGRLSAYEDDIAPLLQSADPAENKRGQKRSQELTKLKTAYRAAFEAGDSASLQSILDRIAGVERAADAEDAAAAGQAPAPATGTAPSAPEPAPETPAQPDAGDSTDLSGFKLTKGARKEAEANGITVAELTDVEPANKYGIGVKQVRAIVKARGQTEAAPDAAVAPEAPAPEATVAPEAPAAEAPTQQVTEVKYRGAQQEASIKQQLGQMGLTEDDFLGMINAGQIEVSPNGKVTQAGRDAFRDMFVDGVPGKKEPLTAEELIDDEINITEVKYRSAEQQKSITNILSKANLDEDDLADLVESNILPVTGNGVLTKEAQKNLRAYLKANTARQPVEAPDIDTVADGVFEKLLKDIDEDTLMMMLRDDPDTFRYLIEQKAPKGRGDEITDWMLGQMNPRKIDVEVQSNSSELKGQIASLNTRDKKRLLEIMRQEMAKDKKLTPDYAKVLAYDRLISDDLDRANQRIPSASGREPIDTTAGRTTRGKIQSFLRNSTDIGGGYGVIGRAPQVLPGTEGKGRGPLTEDEKIIYGHEAAVDEARKTQMIPDDNGVYQNKEVYKIVKYTSLGGEKVYATNQGKMKEYGTEGKKKFVQSRAKKGETLYVDSRGKSYRSIEALEGWETVKPEDGLDVDEPYIPKAKKLREAGAVLRGGGSIKDYLDAVKGIDSKSVAKETANTTPLTVIPDLPAIDEDGMRLAVLPNDPDKNIRVISNKQIEAGKTLSDLVGKMPDGEWTAGYVNGSATTGSRLANDSFVAWKADSVEPKKVKSFLTQKEAGQELVSVTVDDISRLVSLAENLPNSEPDLLYKPLDVIERFVDLMSANGGMASKADLNQMITDVDLSLGWPEKGATDTIKFVSDLYQFKAKYVPEDIRLDTLAIKTSQADFKRLFSDFSNEELAEGKRLIEMLATDGGRGAPKFEGNTYRGDGLYRGANNSISLATKPKGIDESQLPNDRIRTLAHEMGHWTYANLLSTEDKLEFWGAMSKYIDADGQVNEASVADKLPKNAETLGEVFHPPGIRSPQEFFAEQFSMWTMQNKASGFARSQQYGESIKAFHGVSDSFWKKVSKVVLGVFNRAIDPKNIDPDLEKLFARILPDGGEAMTVRDAAPPSTPAGQTIVRVAKDLNMLVDDLEDQVELYTDHSANPEALINAALDFAKRLYGMSATGRKKEFAPLQLTQKTNAANARLARQIFDILKIDSVDDLVDGDVDFAAQLIDPSKADDLYKFLALEGNAQPHLKAHEDISKNLRRVFNRLIDEDLEMFPESKTLAKRKESQQRTFFKERFAKGRAQRQKAERKITQEKAVTKAVIESKQSPQVTETSPAQSPSFKTMSTSELEKIKTKLVASGTASNEISDELVQVSLELEARANTERVTSLSPIAVTDTVTADAINREIREGQGIDANSLSASGPASVREAQEKMGHRTNREGYKTRSIFLRLNNISEASDEGIAQRLVVAARGDEFDPITAGSRDTFDNDFSSDAFASLRDRMRNISKLLNRGDESGVEQVVEMVLRLDGIDPSANAVISDNTNVIGEVMSRIRDNGSMYNASRHAEQVAAYDAIIDRVALVLNGHLDKDLRRAFPQIDSRGNLFERKTDVSIPARPDVMPPIVSTNREPRLWNASSDSRKRAINEFIGDGLSKGDDRPLVFYTNSGNRGRNPIAYRYSSQAAEETGVVDIKGKGKRTDADQEKIDELLNEKQTLNDRLEEATRNSKDGTIKLEESLIDGISFIDDELIKLGVEVSGPEPVYISASNVADFGPRARYTNDSSFVSAVVKHLVKENYFTARQATQIGPNQPDSLAGNEVLDMILNMMGNKPSSRNDLSLELNRMGFDGFTSYDPKKVSPTDRPVERTEIFDSAKVRFVDNGDFDVPPIGDESAIDIELQSVTSTLLSSKTLDINIGQPQTTALVQTLLNSGVNPNAASGLGKMMGGKYPDNREASAIQRAITVSIGSNSERLRENGMSWVADWIAPPRDSGVGHFERTNGRTGGILIPIFKQMRQLSDARGTFGNWLRRSTDLSFKGSDRMRMDQPQSHRNIVNALRNQPGGRHEAKLTMDEQGVYKMVRGAFNTLRREMVDAGVMIGNIENYFPQVWSMEKVLQNEADFKERLIRYFALEAKEEGRVLTRENAEAQAQRVFGHIIDEDGVYVEPPTGGSRDVTGDHIDYQRMIRLDKYPELLDDVGRYLEDDLESVLAKYVDSASRRIDFASKYGNQSHGFHDYMNILEDAGDTTDAVTKLLTTKKITSKKMRSISDTGSVDEGELVRETLMPFENDVAGAKAAAQELLAMAERGATTPEMLEYLRAFDESADPADKAVFSKRSEAIVGGVQDRVRMGNNRPHNEHIKSAMEIFRAVQRKPVGASGAGYAAMNTASKAVRNFNSVSLLSFTTLTSLGDPMLTAVRSGSPVAFTKAMTKYASDPHYRSFIQNAGLAIENVVHERLTGMHGTAASKNTVAFFNATMLTPWTNLNRNMAGAVGLEFFYTEYDRALTNYNPNMPATQQNTQFKKAFRVLRRYGLDKYLDDGMTSIRGITDFNQHPELRSAMNKFANEAIFTPNPNDVPLWAQTPVGAMIFQLKSYPLMLGRLVNDSIKQATEVDPVTGGGRRFGPLLMLATAAPLGGALSLAAKDIVQKRGEDNETFRERKLSKIAEGFGFDTNIHGDRDDYLGWYVESMVQIGGLGLIANMFYDTAEQLDNGAYGKQRIASTIFGPSVGLFNDAVNVVQGVTDTNEDANGKERSAARSVVGRIPVVGGIKPLKEAAVDEIAGEVKKKGSSWGKGWSKGWD